MQELPLHHTDWLLAVLMLSFVVMITVKLYNAGRLRDFAILPFHSGRKELEESFNPVPGKGFVDLSLSLNSTLIITISCFLLLHPYEDVFPEFNDWTMFLMLLFALLIFFLFKNFMGLLVGWVFHKSDEIAEAQNINLAYRTWLGIILLPICTVAVFFQPAYPVVYFILLFVLSVGYFLAFQFSALRIWSMGVLPYYKLLYLCALEITPLIFLVGWLKSLVG
jgi:hypothetical protein